MKQRWQSAEEFLEALEKEEEPGKPQETGVNKANRPDDGDNGGGDKGPDIPIWELISEGITVIIALAAFLNPDLFPQGMADLLIEITGFIAALIAVAIPAYFFRRSRKEQMAGRFQTAKGDFRIFASVVIVALVVLLFGFLGYLAFLNNNHPPSPPLPATTQTVSEKTATTATPTPIPPTATPIPPTNTPVAPTATPTPSAAPEIPVATPSAPSTLYIEYIIDASSGMMQPWTQSTEPKLASLQRALFTLWQNSASQANIGLRAYGHRHPSTDSQTCSDVELLLPIRHWDADTLTTKLFGIQAQGLDSMAEALRYAFGDFQYKPDRLNAVILLTEGGDNCGGDPLSILEAQKEIGIQLPIYVIGLEPDAGEAPGLKQIAEASGGAYYEVYKTSDIYSVLSQLTEYLVAQRP